MATGTQSSKTWLGGAAAGAAALTALGWFAVIGPEMSGTSAIKHQTSDARADTALLQVKVNRLRAENDKLAVLGSTLREARRGLPVDSDLPAYTRQLLSQATKAQVSVTGITVGAPVTASIAGSAATGTIPTGNPAGHLFAIPINVVATGTLADERAFLHSIQVTGPRRALVTSLQFASGSTGKVTSVDAGTTLTAQLQVFVAPQTPTAEAQLRKQLGGSLG